MNSQRPKFVVGATATHLTETLAADGSANGPHPPARDLEAERFALAQAAERQILALRHLGAPLCRIVAGRLVVDENGYRARIIEEKRKFNRGRRLR